MSVVGFDIGNENCVIAAAKQQGIDVLLNDESARETPTVVSFGEKQRFMGSAGAASAAMQPKSTISQIKRLIGRKFNDSTLQDDLRLFPFETSEGPDGGILVHLQYLNEKQTFTPIQILAMLLSHLKQITEKNLGSRVSDIVIGIPSYSTDFHRHSYLQAAQIAGLNVLRLMHDCTATALGYGIYKTDFSRGGSSSTNVVFVDIGHSDTQVAIVSFQPGNMKVLSHAFDRNLGGRDFDEVLFRYFASQFREQNGIDVYTSTRASVRLRASCEKVKKILSANPEAALNIECLMEEKDVKGYIKREDFEKLSSDLLERISIPCRMALFDSRLTVEKIHSVELVGSGSRIPAITKILHSIFTREPSRTLNSSECVAFGCALQCAMLSPAFRVRKYEVQDCLPFSIGLTSDERPVCALTNTSIFRKGFPFPSLKMLTIHKSDTFHMEAIYSNQEELPSGVSSRISSFQIGPVRVTHADNTKIKIQVQLNLHGMVTIESASLIKNNFDVSTLDNTKDVVSKNTEPNSHNNFIEDSGSEDPRMINSNDTMRQELCVFTNVYGGLTLDELSQAHKKELELALQDIKMERAKDTKNTLESYVYETRNKLLNTYRSFATDSQKEGICSILQETEDWLYEDGDDESESVYTKRLEDLKTMVDPIESRYKDEEARALASRNLLKCIVDYKTAAEELPPSERDAVFGECHKAMQWLQEKTQQQDLLPKNEDPILWSSEINAKAEALAGICKHMAKSTSSSNREHVREPEARGENDDMDVD